jgi:alkylation response protein AidB-like acyl-CoA dehydrogenase
MASAAPEQADALEAFRHEARDWIAANFPDSLRDKAGAMMSPYGADNAGADGTKWRKAVGAKGWGTPTWPRQYGGGGLSRAEAAVLNKEMARAGAWSPIGGMGILMFGPTLLEYGSEEQKLRHMPAICSADIRWCQGYSEPGAGSDLASLQTFAEDKGDHYLVNGQKTWTSGGQWADWCFAIVRTDKTKKHEGITFLLIDMKSPGVTVKPIRMISGISPFCETFFDNVKVPKENRVGAEGQGWTIGKRLLQHERTNISGGGGRMAAAMAQSLVEHARTAVGVDAEGRIADPELRARIAKFEMEWRAFLLTTVRVAQESKATGGVSEISSILRTVGTRLVQERAELMIEIGGLQALGWEGDGFSADELANVRGWLGGKASTIYGGSTEIQNNVIAKRILGMLDHQ